LGSECFSPTIPHQGLTTLATIPDQHKLDQKTQYATNTKRYQPGLIISDDDAKLRALDLLALSLVSEEGCLGGLPELAL
jgi:hypothetical protein